MSAWSIPLRPILMMAGESRRRPLRAEPPVKRRVEDPATSPPPKVRTWLPRITRDLALFATGLGLTVNEAVLRDGEPRTQLLILYAGMMGLPAVFQADGALAQILRRDPPPPAGEER